MFNPADDDEDFIRADEKVLQAKHKLLQAIMAADQTEPETILDLMEDFICQIVFRELDVYDDEVAAVAARDLTYDPENLGI
jgi:hypothetical protein